MQTSVPDHTERLQRTGRPPPMRPRTGRRAQPHPVSAAACCARCRRPVEPKTALWRTLYEWEHSFLCRNCFIDAVTDALTQDPAAFAREMDLLVITYPDWG